MNIKIFIEKIFYLIKRLISPPFCANCRVYLDDYEVFCIDCLALIRPIVSKDIKLGSSSKLTVIAAGDYEEPIRSLIMSKFSQNLAFTNQLAYLIWKLSVLKNLDFDYLVPIPLHWTRKLWRGYNQSELIAKELSKLSSKPILNCLKRIKRTKYQASLPQMEREENLKHAFELRYKDKSLEGKTLVLVDDVMTTGSTLKSAAKELLKYKPKAIYAVVACRVC